MVHLVLGLLLLISALLIWIAFSVEPPLSTGTAHAEIAGMRIGGDGLARLGGVGQLFYWVQVLVLAFSVIFIVTGINRKYRNLRFLGPVFLVGLAYQWVWWKIWQGYQLYLQTGEASYAFGFTTPTAWMIFGVWGCGFFLMVIYVAGFREFIFTKDDEAKYEQLLHEVRQQGSDLGGKG
jgi:hypothetical protein